MGGYISTYNYLKHWVLSRYDGIKLKSFNNIYVGSSGSAGIDLPISNAITLKPKETAKINHSLYIVSLNSNYLPMIFSRSSTFKNGKLYVDNIISEDISTKVTNITNNDVEIPKDTSVSQLVFVHEDDVEKILNSEYLIQEEVESDTEDDDTESDNTESESDVVDDNTLKTYAAITSAADKIKNNKNINPIKIIEFADLTKIIEFIERDKTDSSETETDSSETDKID